VIASGDITRREDANGELLIAVLSNSMHIAARTGRVICCPYVPGRIADDTLPLVVGVENPPGTLLTELVQWLPIAALGEPIGNVGTDALARAGAIISALISP
jgi:hypothetical protein